MKHVASRGRKSDERGLLGASCRESPGCEYPLDEIVVRCGSSQEGHRRGLKLSDGVMPRTRKRVHVAQYLRSRVCCARLLQGG